MIDCLIIADDLTGACDAAVQFAMRGRRTFVSVGLASPPPGSAAFAVSTDSRELPAEDLRRLMDEVASCLPARQAEMLFKKIDSTLRGNVGAEVAAALDAFGYDAAVITPAFPALKRIVEAGFLRVLAEEPFAPVEVARRLRWQGAQPCTHVRPEAVVVAIESGARFISVDATCDADLDAVVAAGLSSRRRVLWAGSGGLASALARTLAPLAREPGPAREPVGKILFCLGSDHPVTVRQEEGLRAMRPEHPILRIPRGEHTVAEIRERVVPVRPEALVLSGGDTASMVCRAFDVDGIVVQDEILPGIPRGVLTGGTYDGLPVATKAGGFGERTSLIQVADFFTCRKL